MTGGARDSKRLMLFDLDNTLIDRAAAFRSWAARFVRERELEPDVVDWLDSIDDDGVKPRETFFAEVRDRYGIADPVDALVSVYRAEIPALIPPPSSGTTQALRTLRTLGWRIGIVTNGSPAQEAHLKASGLEGLIDGYAISSIVGARKPDPRLFLAAAEQCGASLNGGWMVGDRADADVAGAIACGMSSAWISRGRTWDEQGFRPDIIAGSVSEAVAAILDQQ